MSAQLIPQHTARRRWARCVATRVIALTGSITVQLSHAADTPIHDVTTLAPLLREAVLQGVARGHLVGPVAEALQRRFDAQGPIEIEVRRLHRLDPDPGCARLDVLTRQRDVIEAGQRHDAELRWQISYCADAEGGHLFEAGTPEGR